jgi:hypothetical protein
MAEGSNTVPETPFLANVFFDSLTNQETRSMWLDGAKISALVDKFNEDEVNTVWKAQDLSEAALIAMGVSKHGVVSLHTKIGLLHGGASVGEKRTVGAHGSSLKKQRVGTGKYVLRSLLSGSVQTRRPFFRYIFHSSFRLVGA